MPDVDKKKWIVTPTNPAHPRVELVVETVRETTAGALAAFNGEEHAPDVVAWFARDAWASVERVSEPFLVIDLPAGTTPKRSEELEAALIDHLASLIK